MLMTLYVSLTLVSTTQAILCLNNCEDAKCPVVNKETCAGTIAITRICGCCATCVETYARINRAPGDCVTPIQVFSDYLIGYNSFDNCPTGFYCNKYTERCEEYREKHSIVSSTQTDAFDSSQKRIDLIQQLFKQFSDRSAQNNFMPYGLLLQWGPN